MLSKIKKCLSLLMAAAMITTIADVAVPMRAAAMDDADDTVIEDIKDVRDDEPEIRADIGNVIDEDEPEENNYSESSSTEDLNNGFIENDYKSEELDVNDTQNQIDLLDTLTYGQLTYTVNDDNQVTITGCDKSATSVVIPAQIDGMDVAVIGERSFMGCYQLTSVKISESVTEIGISAFEGCSNLSSINIPNGVTSIEWRTFYNCKSLDSIQIPESVTSIVNHAFYGCSNLKNINLPNGITRIASSTFYNCESLNGIKIPESVASIDNDAFSECINLSSINIPNGVTYIGSSTFYNCKSLDNIKIPESVASIGVDAFNGCINLSSINIPNGVTYIGSSTFYNCESLNGIKIPESVTKIGEWAFGGCINLSSINIPESVTSIGRCTFNGCSALSSINIPESVISIGEHTFDGCSALSSINIPESVTSIGKYTFNGCSALSSINIPESVISIGEYTFNGCSALSSINIPESVASIGKYAFYGCESLSDINIPKNEDLKNIEEYTFSGCNSLVNINIPENIRSIGNYAFWKCKNLKNINIPELLSNIGVAAFSECNSLESINIPIYVSYISGSTFSGCSNLKNINIPDGVTIIGDYAFYECYSLVNVNIQEGIWGSAMSLIGKEAFSRCKNLKNINIPDKVTCIEEGAFEGCDSLENINIPPNITAITAWLFSGCSSLTNIKIPKRVTSIGIRAFSRCNSLTSIKIPESLEKIDDDAFYGCRPSNVYYSGTKEDFEKIDGVSSLFENATIHYESTDYIQPDTGNSGIQDYSFGFYNGDYMNKKENNPKYMVIGNDCKLRGILQHNDLSNLDKYGTLLEDFNNITWSISDTSVAEITEKVLEDDSGIFVYSNWYLTLKCIKPGTVTVTGTLKNGQSTSWTLNVEPEIEITAPERISGKGASSVISATIKFNEIDRDGIEAYAKDLKCVLDYGSASISDKKYRISDDMKSATVEWTFNVEDGTGSHVLRADVVSASGYTKSAYIKAKFSSVDFYAGAEDDVFRPEKLLITYDDKTSSYSQNKLPITLKVVYETKDADSKLLLNALDFNLNGDICNYFKIKGKSHVNVNKQISGGEEYTYTVELVKKGLWNKHPENGETATGSITVDIDCVGEISEKLKHKEITIELSNPYEAAEDDLSTENIDNDIDKYAEEIVKAYEENDLSSKIALDPQIESYIGRKNHQEEGVKMAIYMAVSLANMSKDNTSGSNLSDEVVEKVMNKFLGDWDPKLPQLKVNNIPLTLRVKDDNGKWVTCDFECNITHYNWESGNPFGMTGTISTKISFPGTGKIPVELADGMFYKTDMKAFTEGGWNLSKSYLLKGYKKVWGDDLNKAANHIMEKSIDSIADKAAEYALKKPVQDALNALYKKKFKDKAADKLFDFLVYPSKVAVGKCPVDVFVYNSSNELVGSIENNVVTKVSDGLNLWVENDDKYIQLYDESYRIEYKATGSGSMDVDIYDLSSGMSPVRCTGYQALPLETGVTYTGNVNNEILTDPDNYALTSNNNEKFNYDVLEEINEAEQLSGSEYTFKSSIKNESGKTVVTFTNASSDAATGLGIVAEYDKNGKMIDIQTKELTLGFDGSESITLGDTDVIYKAYVLDSSSSLKMISPVVEYSRLSA